MGSRVRTKDENISFLLSCKTPCLLLSIVVACGLIYMLLPLPHLNFSMKPNIEKRRQPNLSLQTLYQIDPEVRSRPPRVWVKACKLQHPLSYTG